MAGHPDIPRITAPLAVVAITGATGGYQPGMGKQMEGDNAGRRRNARDARQRGTQSASRQTTLGSSKGRERVRQGKDHDVRLTARDQGKQPGNRRTG